MPYVRLRGVIILFLALAGFTACNRAPSESRLIGTWRIASGREVIELTLRKDHSTRFYRSEPAASAINESGTWRLQGDDLVLALPNEKDPLEIPVVRFRTDLLVLKMADGVHALARFVR